MFGISKSTAYDVFKRYREQGGQVIILGGQHAQEEQLIEFLRGQTHERGS